MELNEDRKLQSDWTNTRVFKPSLADTIDHPLTARNVRQTSSNEEHNPKEFKLKQPPGPSFFINDPEIDSSVPYFGGLQGRMQDDGLPKRTVSNPTFQRSVDTLKPQQKQLKPTQLLQANTNI